MAKLTGFSKNVARRDVSELDLKTKFPIAASQNRTFRQNDRVGNDMASSPAQAAAPRNKPNNRCAIVDKRPPTASPRCPSQPLPLGKSHGIPAVWPCRSTRPPNEHIAGECHAPHGGGTSQPI